MRREHKDTVFELSTLANQPFQGPVGGPFLFAQQHGCGTRRSFQDEAELTVGIDINEQKLYNENANRMERWLSG